MKLISFLRSWVARRRYRNNPLVYGHIITIDRRTHDHLTHGWGSVKETRNRKLHWMDYVNEIDVFIREHDGLIIPNDLTYVSTFYDFEPSERERDTWLLHQIAFPNAESAVLFKLTFL